MEVERKKMLIKYWEDKYSIGHMALFLIKYMSQSILIMPLTCFLTRRMK
jgi:hypothetical protein